MKKNRTDHPISHYYRAEHPARGVCGDCTTHGGHETAEVRDVRRTGGGAWAALRARKKSGWGVSWATSELSVSTPTKGRRLLLQPRTMGNNNGTRRRNKQRTERFMAKWMEEVRAGLRHAVCPNVTGRTKGRIAQSNKQRVRADDGVRSLALVDQPQEVARTYILRAAHNI